MIIQRVNCDYYNSTKSSVEAVCDYNVSAPVIESADEFRVTVETAEVSLTQMPLDLNAEHSFLLLYKRNTPEEKYVHFPLPRVIKNINHFMEEINKICTYRYDGNTINNPGPLFYAFDIDTEGFLSAYDPGQYHGDLWVDYEYMISRSLLPILSEFTDHGTGYWPRDKPVNERDTYYRLKKKDVIIDVKQRFKTIDNLVKFKSVRFITNLPVRSYKVYRQNTEQMVDMNILTTIKINSSGFDLMRQRNLLYIPTEFREIELVSNAAITNFRIYIEIYYSDGSTYLHRLAPGEYFELALAFKQYKINSEE